MDTNDFTKHLRKNQTSAEQLMWENLRNRRCGGYKFRRQVRIDNYVVDFLCVAKKVVIEIDGPTHEGREDYDAERTKHIENRGYHVLRFSNDDVYDDVDAVIEAIFECLTNICPLTRPSGTLSLWERGVRGVCRSRFSV